MRRAIGLQSCISNGAMARDGCAAPLGWPLGKILMAHPPQGRRAHPGPMARMRRAWIGWLAMMDAGPAPPASTVAERLERAPMAGRFGPDNRGRSKCARHEALRPQEAIKTESVVTLMRTAVEMRLAGVTQHVRIVKDRLHLARQESRALSPGRAAAALDRYGTPSGRDSCSSPPFRPSNASLRFGLGSGALGRFRSAASCSRSESGPGPAYGFRPSA